MVVDIEGIFNQVRVDQEDCGVLRFLWWKGASLEAQQNVA